MIYPYRQLDCSFIISRCASALLVISSPRQLFKSINDMPKVYTYYNFCLFLKDCFYRHHIQQQVFCKDTGIDPAHLSRILNGKSNPTLKTIFKIVRYIDGVTLSIDDDALIRLDLDLK